MIAWLGSQTVQPAIPGLGHDGRPRHSARHPCHSTSADRDLVTALLSMTPGTQLLQHHAEGKELSSHLLCLLCVVPNVELLSNVLVCPCAWKCLISTAALDSR